MVNEDISLDPDIAKRNFTISYDLLHYPDLEPGKPGNFRGRESTYITERTLLIPVPRHRCVGINCHWQDEALVWAARDLTARKRGPRQGLSSRGVRDEF